MPENDHPFADLSVDGDSITFMPVGAKVINTAPAGAQMEAPPRRRVEKAYDDGRSEALEEEPRTGILSSDEVIIPPLQLELLVNAFEESNALRQNVDAMTTNVDGFGFDVVSAMPTVGADARGFVEDLLFDEGDGDNEPTADAVKEKLAALIKLTSRERRKAKNFFHYVADESFIELRRSSREDLEALGNFTWEVLRDNADRIARFVHLPFYTMRLTKLTDPTEVTIKRKIDPITFKEFKETRRFRKFIQEVSNEVRYYKEFGDPRLISKKNGRIFKDKEEYEAAKKDDKDEGLATEVLHYKIRALRGPYGLPRYTGNLLSVRGSRLAEEVNFFYFQNRAIPPMMIFVENGTLADTAVKRLEEFFQEIKGDTRNFWKVAILEGESQEVARRRGVAWGGQPRFKIVKLSSEQLKDALFQEYDANNRDKVGESFRMPRLLRGDVRDFNRACYSGDTETLTENGWKLHNEVSPDERIAAVNKETGEMKFVVPECKHVYPVNGEEMVRFHNDHVDCLVTPDHTMLARSAQTRAKTPPWEVHKSGKIPWNRFEFRQAPDLWIGEDELVSFALPKSSGCKIERGHDHETSIPGDLWLEFLGYFISEGGLLTTDHPAAPYLVYIDQKKPGVREKIRSCLERTGWAFSEQKKPCGTTHFLFSNRCLRDYLIREVGTHAQDKRIPWNLLSLPSRQLKILFDAMMAGDGSVDPRANRDCGAYYSTSTVLSGQVQRLLLQLGMRNTYKWNEGIGCGRVVFTPKKTTNLCATGSERRPPCVERIRYQGEVYCFSVPGWGFFVTRRNGKIAIQGNTAETAKAFGEEQVFQPERDRFDAWINRVIMPALDFRLVEFKSLSSVVRDPFSLTEMTEKLVKAGILIPEEGRQIAEDIFNRDFAKIEEDWVKRPIPLTIAGRMEAEGAMGGDSAKSLRGALGLGEPGAPIDVAATISRLRELRNVLAGYVSDTPAGAVYAPGNAEND